MRHIDLLVEVCVQKGYVTEKQAPWLRYALERRLVSLVVFLSIGLLITTPVTLIAFVICFYSLRARTNGYHAKSIVRCLIYSIVAEVFFLRVLPTVWNDMIACAALAISTVLIWILAPYNHPNMNLAPEEILACGKSAKFRLSMLIFALSTLYVWGKDQFARGILLGIVMKASALATAYVKRERSKI